MNKLKEFWGGIVLKIRRLAPGKAQNKDHHDFKPILSEIEERPPNPLGSFFLWTILIFMLLAVIGLFVLKVDVVVSARGKVIPVGDVKVVQPLETGMVIGIHVKEGDFVEKGAVLLEIDPSVDKAELEGKDQNLKVNELSMVRIKSVLDEKKFRPSQDYPRQVMAAQAAHYKAQRDIYQSKIREKEKEMRETATALKSCNDEAARLKEMAAITREDEKRQKSLVEVGALAENRYLEKVKDRVNLERQLDAKKAEAEQNATKLERLQDELATFKHTYKEKLLSDYSTSLQSKNTLEAEVTSLRFKQEKRFILAPVSGYINQLQAKTIGGVVTAAQPVASIVPEKTPLQVKAMLSNKDIGFVKENQKVVVKVDTYDFQKYGTIDGEVQTISPFSVDSEKQNANSEPGGQKDPDNGESAQGGYPVYVKLNSEKLVTKSNSFSLKPGMSVSAEINVGKRRVIEFFLFPIIRYLDEGLKVR